MTEDGHPHARVALGLRSSETVRQTVMWADELFFCDLTGADLSGLNLAGKRFVGCVLSGCSFRAAALDGVRFRTCVASGQPASFEGASIGDARLENCNFSLPDGVIRPAWEEFSDEILAAASGDAEDLLYDVCNPEYLEADEEHEAALFFAAQALYADEPRLRVEAVQGLGAVLEGRPDVAGSALDALVALVALRAGDSHADVFHEVFSVLAELEPSRPAVEMLHSLLYCPDRTILHDALSGLRSLLARFDWGDRPSYRALLQALVRAEEAGQADLLVAALGLWYDHVRMVGIHDGEEASRLGSVLARLLRHPSPDVRKVSLSVLGRLYAWDGRDEIVPLLQDDDPEVRERAWQTLSGLTNEGADFRAFVLTYPPSARARDSLASECARLRESGRPSLLGTADELAALVASPDPEQRRQGIYFLGLVRDPGQSGVLLTHLSDRDAKVRLEALGAVAASDIPDAATAIEPLCADPDQEVRAEATLALDALRMGKRAPR
jgi:hypothetical protein